jgi:protein-disulfide isomerase
MRAFTRWIIVAAAVSLVAACSPKGGGSAAAGVMTLGDPNAKVKVDEYASATCPHCARFNEEVFPAFKAKYVDTGKVYYRFHEFLTPPTNVAAASFLVARCAGKDKYFSVLDAIFHSQNEMFTTGDPRSVLFRIGRGAGLNDDQITKCIQDDKALKALNDRVDQAAKDGVQGTPTFMVNGKKLDGQVLAGTTYQGGEISLAQLDAALAPLLKP